MKQKLLSKVMFLLFAFIAGTSLSWADEASFAPSNFSGQGTSGTGSAISATVSGVTFACNKGYGTTQIRCYSGGNITISSSNTITGIAFTFSGSYTGGLETSYTSLSTTSWTKSLSTQARITAITVTYITSSAVATTTTIVTTGITNTDLKDGTAAGSLSAIVKENKGNTSLDSPTITWTSSDTGVATVDESGVVTLVDEGSATITATYAGNEDYNGSFGEYDLTVVDTRNLYYKFNLAEKSYSSASADEVVWVNNSVVKIVADKAKASTNANNYLPIAQNSSRFYKNSTITFTPAAGVTIISVTYTATSVGYATAMRDNTWTNASAKLDEDDTKVVIITPSDGTKAVIGEVSGTTGGTDFTIKYRFEEQTYSRTVTADHYGTICLPYATTAAPEGATFYTVGGTTENGVMLVEHDDALVAGTPYVFKATASEISATYTGFAADVQDATGLVGNLSATPMDVPTNCYVLSSNVLRKVATGGAATVGQYRAYFNLSGVPEYSGGTGVKAVVLGWNEATGIDLPATEKAEKVIFDLSGRRVEKPAKGLYIVNGKKVLF